MIFSIRHLAPLYSLRAFAFILSESFQLRRLVGIQHIHDGAQLRDRRQRRIVSLVALRLVEDDEAAGALVQHADDDLVEDHLRQLALDLLGVEADHLCDVVDLDAREGLDDLDEVLLEHRVVQAAQVVADERVAAQLELVVAERLLVLLERAVRVRARDRLHRLQVLAGVLDGLLRGHQLRDVVVKVQHDLAQQHVLQRGGGLGRLVLRVVAVQRLDEVGEGGVEVLVFGVQHAGLHVQACLEEGWGVDGGGGGARAGEGGTALGDVA